MKFDVPVQLKDEFPFIVELYSRLDVAWTCGADCMTRAKDGIEAMQWDYALGQLARAQTYIQEVRFLVDLLELLGVTPSTPKVPNGKPTDP